MPLTSYCKKCARDVPVGERCPHCGSKLAANTVRLAWCVDHAPLRDWMSWNAVMRVALPVLMLALVLALVIEGVTGGVAGIEAIIREGLPLSLLGVAIFGSAVLLLLFIYRETTSLTAWWTARAFMCSNTCRSRRRSSCSRASNPRR